MKKLDNWINGENAQPESGNYEVTVNPANGEELIRAARSSASDVNAAVRAAKAAAWGWRHFPAPDRGRLLHAMAQKIRERADEFAQLEMQDTGKPRALVLGEIENSAAYFEFYSGLVNLPIGDNLDVMPNQHIYTRREPFGVVGIITPWNVPLNQAARACAPALAAGNTIVAKPAETSSQTTVALAKLATEVGFPQGVLNVVLGHGSVVGNAIVSHELIRKVAFTGSVKTGRSIGRIAAERIIPLTLELGGKSANIVFEDADFEFAAKEAVRAFTSNAGQVCSAGTRLLVQKSIHDKFVKAVADIASRIVVGKDMGPMITQTQFEQVQEYFRIAEEEGAFTETGGKISSNPDLAGGFYVEPTVYSGVTNDMRIAQEEIFGPVLVAMPFETEEEAIAIANDSDFGLISAVFTKDIARAFRVSDAMESGQVFVNSWSTGAVQTSFGGHKLSGYGREKGIESLQQYGHTKCVVVVN